MVKIIIKWEWATHLVVIGKESTGNFINFWEVYTLLLSYEERLKKLDILTLAYRRWWKLLRLLMECMTEMHAKVYLKCRKDWKLKEME